MQTSNSSNCLFDRLSFNIYGWYISELTPDQFQAVFVKDISPGLIGRFINTTYAKYEIRADSQISGFISAYYRSQTRSVELRLNISVNANRLLRTHLLPGSEVVARVQALDHNTNWLPRDLLSSVGKELSSIQVNCVVHAIEDYIKRCRHMVMSRISTHLHETEPKCSVSSAEVYVDNYASCAIAGVAALRPMFESLFSNTTCRHFSLEHFQEQSFGNSMGLSGTFKRGERYQVYVKTSDTIRFEVSITGERIRLLLRTNECAGSTEGYLLTLLSRVSEVLLLKISAFMNPRTSVSENQHRDLIRELHKGTRNESEFIEVLQLLLLRGRITSEKRLYCLIKRLKNRGLITKETHGLYRVASQYEDQLVALRTALSNNEVPASLYQAAVYSAQGQPQRKAQ